MAAPGWQTEELQDEWVELEPEDSVDDENNLSYGTHSLSLTVPLPSHIHTNYDLDDLNISTESSNRAAGTFLIRDDIPDAPFQPKTPNRNKGLMKDIFTPLPLERMFEPPSPPKPDVSLEHDVDIPLIEFSPPQTLVTSNDQPSNTPKMTSIGDGKQNIACQFTFTVPRGINATPRPAIPQAQSTPNPPLVFYPKAPATDPRLRLFQFQYDTYTREHLSAMVDSIAINNPSVTGTTPSPTSFDNHLSRVSEMTGPSSLANVSHLRSAKRVKLSPLSDYSGEGAGSLAVISRPRFTGKDYLGESKQLMQQIKSARDFSTISTNATTPQKPSPVSEVLIQPAKSHALSMIPPRVDPIPAHLRDLNDGESNPSTSSSPFGSRRSQYSSSSYRAQAEALMAQIKQSVKGQKRIFSGETEVGSQQDHQHNIAASGRSTPESTVVSVRSSGGSKGSSRHSPVLRRSTSSRSSHQRTGSQTSTSSRSSAAAPPNDLVDGLAGLSVSERPPPNNLVHAVHGQSQPFSSLAPPVYPSASLRAGATEELNRFVSSSTVGGTTSTTGSTQSFVKHPGPAHIRTISPQDIPALPDRFGDMIFDRVNSRWIRNPGGVVPGNVDEPSEDPFVDIESLRDESRPGGDDNEHGDPESGPEGSEEDETARQGHYSVVNVNEMTRIEERSEIDDEEVDLMSFSTDASSHVVSVMTGVDPNAVEDGVETTDSEDNVELIQPGIRPLEFDSEDEDFHSLDVPKVTITQEPNLPSSNLVLPVYPSSHFTPHRIDSATQTTPVIRSALKSHATTPTSVLKDPNRARYQTPLQQRSPRRSVSFSDGKLEGPIQGLRDSSNSTSIPFSLDGSGPREDASSEMSPSARSKRIEQMMQALEDSDFSEGDSSPSKGSSIRVEELQPLSARQPNDSPDTRRVFSRSPSRRPASSKLDQANGTFLTECSFGVAHDRLVNVITDVQPFEPYWETLTSINLSGKNLESVARLKEFLPRLDALNLLTGLTSFGHLVNLENLDISRNDIDSLRQLECLRHLRELKADHNKITSLDGLQNMDGLVKLSVQNNLMQSIDLIKFKWKRLEMLNASQNRLESIIGVKTLQSLVALNLDNNCLRTMEVDGSMPRLRILRLSGNRLRQVDVGAFANLRTLYADNNSLTHLVKLNRLKKLENLSLRNQSGRGLLLTRDVRDVKRLYLSGELIVPFMIKVLVPDHPYTTLLPHAYHILSVPHTGNPLQPSFISEPCYNMIYLEVAACRLTALPEDMGKLTPNLRVLNLNYNFLEDARPLEGLTRLEKLTIIGSRLKKTKPLIRLAQRMPDIVMLDFRMNPCTLGWYLPLLVKDVPGALQPSESSKSNGDEEEQHEGKGMEKVSNSWQELDAKFRRDLPDELYIGRLAYRGLVMRTCERIRMLDGVGVTEKERTKAQKLLMGILDKNRNKEGRGREGGHTDETRS
ncbi:hypothetical protein NP233_g5760 [Leucocoprinus birnbaumii]|uniref:Septation initiation network scaffold protein cdc11 n=1 Tax=Leucocoprinus birnbaumii TaxID=56174 RepID=A0AAD5YWE2_9AGAR|nr:hypothetical protein NP233_g5760 [Leucocoprinus birnbaumii]